MLTDLRYAMGQLRRAMLACHRPDGGMPARDALANLLSELRDVHQRCDDALSRCIERAEVDETARDDAESESDETAEDDYQAACREQRDGFAAARKTVDAKLYG